MNMIDTAAASPPAFGPYRAVIFDLDGTLIDSLADIATAANFVLADNGYPVHPIASYRTFVGDGVKTLFERALPADQNSVPIVNRCAGAFSSAYARTWKVQTRLYAGVAELLDTLCASPLRLAVLSNKPDAFTKTCMAHFCEAWPFAAIAGQREEIPKKPDPAGALRIALELGLEPREIAFVGDSSVDMQTARNAGMFAIGVSWGFRPVAELWDNGAERVIDSPGELLELIRG